LDPTYIGLIVLGIPLLVGGMLLLRGNRPVLLFYVALLAVALGYLAATGALADIGRLAVGAVGGGKAAVVPAK